MNLSVRAKVGIALGIIIAIVVALTLYPLLLAFGWAWRFWINTTARVLGLLLYASEKVSPVRR